ncbi:MAG: cell division protein FtsQ/DivIB [Actinomycetota bacterium]
MSTAAPPRPPMDDRIAERRAEVAGHRRRRRRRGVASLVALAALLAAGGAVLASPLFALEEVRVRGVEGERAVEVVDAAGLSVGAHLVTADVAGAAERVADLPWAGQVEVRRVPPAAVEVDVVARRPAAAVHLEDATWTVDASGVVLAGGAPEEALPIDAPNSVLPGPGVRASDAAVVNALTFHAALPEATAERVVRYEARSGRSLRMRVAPTGGEEVWVRVGAAEDVERKAQALDLLLEQAGDRLAEGGVAELDVRAPGNPVLVPLDEG